ncbi:MAG: bifunctional precorrin-2 dehydrogenase/sirohydrochlorin ferrochelatase [Firmicutes bacterium]|jgi:precorrin-2 dehydrogenase/sirohydrochlorin ferrochelatase|uniref:precorrin-2 dehydrogenase n=1 Tax=Sulfobacillus benefaciens TaxID=453960 RepID=A0A2T2WVK3_9FIRM|nr:bifunctional precorrin-2 dehydrogenase/sirohydrochlorin ferrochelatase [Bacillota bacterium]MCL5015432.1 bifunctional precorrin-2 dehydrogenase/sirohydrochlorin ferrochelatase [Bacillota bacterium]PSR26242.1 MAG: hypothetical protein C7B43_14480 [Sulfobacillus benefaciens]
MAMLPVMLDMAQFPVVVVGGEAEAEWKIQVLLEARAHITAVSPDASPAIREWAKQALITWLPRCVTEGDFVDSRITYIATHDMDELRKAWEWAKAYHHLINVVDTPALCEFYSASHFRRDSLVISVSTSGQAPALAKALCLRLQSEFGRKWANLVCEIADLRKQGTPAPTLKERAWELVQSNFVSNDETTQRLAVEGEGRQARS